MLGTCKFHFVQEETEAREGQDSTDEVTQSGNAGCFFFIFKFTWLHQVLVGLYGTFDSITGYRIFWLWLMNSQLQHVRSSSPTRNRTQALCTGSAES